MIINYSDQDVLRGKKSIFLAGPTPRSQDVASWRPDAVKVLEELNFDGIVYVLEYSTGEKLFDYTLQVDWETEALENATIIVFWVPRKIPEMMALTTNCEFGEWYKSGKILYGRPDDAKSIKYLDYKYFISTKNKPFNKLEDLIKEAVDLTSK